MVDNEPLKKDNILSKNPHNSTKFYLLLGVNKWRQGINGDFDPNNLSSNISIIMITNANNEKLHNDKLVSKLII